VTTARSLVFGALRRPAFWAWLCLASLPPQLISQAKGLELVDPTYIALLLLWWPVDTLGRLGALHQLLQAEGRDLRRPWAALPSALAAEILLGLRSGIWALLGLIPGIALLSYLGVETGPRRLAVLLVLMLGLIPSALYALRRLLAPRHLLEARLSASEALDASALQLRGKLRPFLLMATPFIAASWALDGLGMALPWAMALLMGPLSLAFSLFPLAFFDFRASPEGPQGLPYPGAHPMMTLP